MPNCLICNTEFEPFVDLPITKWKIAKNNKEEIIEGNIVSLLILAKCQLPTIFLKIKIM